MSHCSDSVKALPVFVHVSMASSTGVAPISACLFLMVTHVKMSEAAPAPPHPGSSSVMTSMASVCRGLEKALDQMDGSWRGASKAQQPSMPAGPPAGVQASSDGTASAAAVQELEQQQVQAGNSAAAKVGRLGWVFLGCAGSLCRAIAML